MINIVSKFNMKTPFDIQIGQMKISWSQQNSITIVCSSSNNNNRIIDMY